MVRLNSRERDTMHDNACLSLAVESLPFSRVSPDLIRSATVFTSTIWKSETPLTRRIEECLEQSRKAADSAFPVMWHVVREGGAVVAMARSFRRVVATSSGQRLPVVALAGVCTRPEQRRRGLGRAVVEAAFARVGPETPVCFFQTGVPMFYLAMGARPVANRIFDSQAAEGTRAFWESHAMIYPRDASWPLESIDLLGPGW
jgi:predicted N-acetyltransferase YhbS